MQKTLELISSFTILNLLKSHYIFTVQEWYTILAIDKKNKKYYVKLVSEDEMTRNSSWDLGYLPAKLHNPIFAYNQTFPCVTGSFQIFAGFCWISSQIAVMPCFAWEQLVFLWSPSQCFSVCIPCMAILGGWGDYTSVYIWTESKR